VPAALDVTADMAHLIKKLMTALVWPRMKGSCLTTSIKVGAFHTGPISSRRRSAASMGWASMDCSWLSNMPDSNSVWQQQQQQQRRNKDFSLTTTFRRFAADLLAALQARHLPMTKK